MAASRWRPGAATWQRSCGGNEHRLLSSASASFGSGPRFLPLFGDQFLLRQFTDRGFRQGMAELELRRQLVPAEFVGQKGPQLLERKGLGGRLQLHKGLGGLAA